MEQRRNPWLALLVLCLGFFVVLLDATIVNVAIPTMLDSLHASLDQILWVVNAFLLTFAVLLVTGGRLGDILGQRNLFVVGLGAFSVASALCGLAENPNQLIAARALQGVGAAILSPQTLVIVSAIFPARRRGAAFGILSGVTGLAALAGPTVGGLIVTYLDWRWIFFVNVPIGIAGIALALLLVPDLRPGKRHRLDLVGVALATAGLSGVVFGLIEGQRYEWGAVPGSGLTIPEILAAGAVLLGAFLAWERFQHEPLVPLSLFRNRNFSVMVWLSALWGFALIGMLLTTTIYLQSVLGMSAVRAGLTTTPLTLCMVLVGPFAGRLTDRIGGRYILMLGFVLFAAGLAGLALVESVSATSFTFTLPLAVTGLGMGCIIAPLTTEAMREVPPVASGAASGTLNTSRQLGSAIGSAVITGAVLQNQLAGAMHERALTAASQLPPQLRQGFINGFADAARSGLEVGRGQSGGAQLPAGLPPQATQLVQRLAHDVFVNAYTTAMRPTLAVAVAGLLLGALSCGLIVRRAQSAGAQPADEKAEESLRRLAS
ncbi:MAG TPA: DHA2 family efflux MFS transporter permease subunit [Candidatus Dormibacteraeota bacterium]|nr:DHA2 family efflux MFS transporter permease subunit [Candidatus Dormibacteraeota bacterium]